MFRKSIFTAVGMAAAAAAGAAAYMLVKNKKEAKETSDDEIHFITIEDGESEEEEEPQEPQTYSAEGRSAEVKEIAAIYPYLDPDFIEQILSKNDEFNASYDEDTLVNVSHHAKFTDAKARKAFVEIMEVGGYETEVKGDDVLSSRKFFTQPGAIISDVLNVANQTCALCGTYESYDIH